MCWVLISRQDERQTTRMTPSQTLLEVVTDMLLVSAADAEAFDVRLAPLPDQSTSQ